MNQTAKINNAEQNYSVHTFELSINLSKEEYLHCKDTLYVYCKEHKVPCYSPRDNVYAYEIFRTEGFTTLYTMRYISSSGCRYSLNIIVNARKLLGYKKYAHICIAPSARTPDMVTLLKAKLRAIGLSSLPFERLHLKRLDLCTNIKFETEHEFDEYFRLICKGKQVYNSDLYLIYDKKQKRKIAPKYSFTLEGNSFEISLYAKHNQMVTSGKYYDQEELLHAQNQLRIELRFSTQKNNELIDNYHGLQELICNIPQIACKYISQYLNSMYGKGDFYRYDIAVAMIEETNFHASTKEQMIKFMKYISKHSLNEAIMKYGKEESTAMLNHFNLLQLSPITLSIRSPYEKLFHPIHYIQTNNVNESPQYKQI